MGGRSSRWFHVLLNQLAVDIAYSVPEAACYICLSVAHQDKLLPTHLVDSTRRGGLLDLSPGADEL